MILTTSESSVLVVSTISASQRIESRLLTRGIDYVLDSRIVGNVFR